MNQQLYPNKEYQQQSTTMQHAYPRQAAAEIPASPFGSSSSGNHLLAEDPFSTSPASVTTLTTTSSLSSSSSSYSSSSSSALLDSPCHQSSDSRSAPSTSNDKHDKTRSIRAIRNDHAQETETEKAGTETGSGGTWTESIPREMQRCDSSNFASSVCSSDSSSPHHQRPLQRSSATNTPAAIRSHARSIRPPLWSCFLGCGKSYKKSSGRSIRRHVLPCYRQHHQAECEGITDEQLNVLIAVKQGQSELQTGLKTWRIRRKSRSAASLPINERWQCPNGECNQYYRSSSVNSIAKHQVTCIHNPMKPINLHSITLSATAATLVLREAPATNCSYQTNTLQTQQFQAVQLGTADPLRLQITLQPLQQHPLAMMSVTPLSAPLIAGVPSALHPTDITLLTGSSVLLHLPAAAPLQLLPVQPQVGLNPTPLPLGLESVTSPAALSGNSATLQHYLRSISQQNHTYHTHSTHSLAPPLPSPCLQSSAVLVPCPQQPVPTLLSILSKSRSAFKRPVSLLINKSSRAETEAM